MTEQTTKQREAGLMLVTGFQGVGKTRLNMRIIYNYVRDKVENKVKGRKCLIFDTNGEYTGAQFAKNDIPDFAPKTLALKDVRAWSQANIAECRRIDAKNVKIGDKKAILEMLIENFRNGMLMIEDINTYMLSITHEEEIIGGLVNLRHRGVDILVSYQSLRAIEPRMFANARWIRLHYQPEPIEHIKNKVTNIELMKIAQIVVSNKYKSGNKYFYVYIHTATIKIEGDFSREEFTHAVKQYLNTKKTQIRDYADMHSLSRDEAMAKLTEFTFNEYWGNGEG